MYKGIYLYLKKKCLGCYLFVMLVIALKFYTIYHLILFSREQYVSFTYIDFICVNWNLTFHWNFCCYKEVVSIQMSQKLTDYISVNLICIFSESIINGMKIIVKSDDIVDVLENSFAQEIGAFYCSCHFRMLNATCNDTKVLRQCWKRVFHTEKKIPMEKFRCFEKWILKEIQFHLLHNK